MKYVRLSLTEKDGTLEQVAARLVAYANSSGPAKASFYGRDIKAKPGESVEFIIERYKQDVSKSAQDMNQRRNLMPDKYWDSRLGRLLLQKNAINQSTSQ